MAKVVKLNPDGSYYGLVERADDDAPPVPTLVTRSGQRSTPDAETPTDGGAGAENASESVYAEWSYAQLRAEVAQRGIKAASQKTADLIAALESHDASR